MLDANVDVPTREKLMRANGQACHAGSLLQQSPPPSLDAFIARIHSYPRAKDVIRREGDTVYFSYVQNPRGLKVADGYCLCPLVETGPAGLSGTFCLCSVGYVQDMFGTMVRHPVKVELLESLKRGGKGCRFTIDVAWPPGGPRSVKPPDDRVRADGGDGRAASPPGDATVCRVVLYSGGKSRDA